MQSNRKKNQFWCEFQDFFPKKEWKSKLISIFLSSFIISLVLIKKWQSTVSAVEDS